MIVGGHTRLAHDTTNRARVDYEILPEFFCRADTGLGCDTANVSSPQQAALHSFVDFVGFVRVFCHYLIIRSTGTKKCVLLRLRIVAIGVV